MYKITFLTLLVVAFGCNQSADQNTSSIKSKNSIDDTDYSLDWIQGKWVDTNVFGGRYTIFEGWEKEGEEVYSGRKCSIKKSDSSTFTNLSIVKTDGKYFYSFIEEGVQSTFVEDSLAQNYIRFTNTKDEFPTTLIYKRINNEMEIFFSGMAKGMYREVSFNTIKQ